MSDILDINNKKSLSAVYPYHCRAIMFLASIAALISYTAADPLSDTITLIIASLILIYILLAYSIRKKPANSKALQLLDTSDGFFIALVISQLHYSPWPSILLVTLVYFHALYQGGRMYWLFTNIGIALGIAIGFFGLHNQQWQLTSPDIVNLSISIGAFVYICIYAISSRSYYQVLTEEYESLNNEVKEQKLRAYEISRYLPKTVWERIEGKKKVKIERKPITIFFSDIVGFPSLGEELEAETLSNALSSYLGEMSKIVDRYNGTIDKFIGDAIMVTFGDDSSTTQGIKKDAIACVSMAIAMGKRMRELQGTWQEMGIKKPLEIRIGINSGYCTVGTFGISQHLDHTALGVHVNLASRLESAGKPGEILVSHETWSLIKDTILCKDKGHIKAKGFTHPVQVYQVVNHRKELGSQQSYVSHNFDGFSMHMDVEKLKNYDQDKILEHLQSAAEKVRTKFLRTTQNHKK